MPDGRPIDAALLVRQDRAEAIYGLRGYLAGRYVKRPLETYARELLGIDPPLTSPAGYRSDSVHPLFPDRGTLHPDNGDVLAYVARAGIARVPELRQLPKGQEVELLPADDILLFGSPASEGLSRVIFGYKLQSSGLYLGFDEQLFDLAYRWDLDEDAAGGRQVRRYVRGRPGAPPRPPWRILNLRGRGRAREYRPLVRPDGFLDDDYLLITKVPNFLTPAYRDGRVLISFGGAHGTGTRAIMVLLHTESALIDIARMLPPTEGRLPESYQLLLRAHPLKHDPEKGSSPVSVQCIDAVRLETRANTSYWDDAQQRVVKRLQAWKEATS